MSDAKRYELVFAPQVVAHVKAVAAKYHRLIERERLIIGGEEFEL
jgi:hypothetical protein